VSDLIFPTDMTLHSDVDSPFRSYSSSRASDFTTDDDNATYSELSSISTLTSFDAYFLHASRPSRTSSNVFSHLVQPLSADEYTASLSRSFYQLPFPATTTSALSISDASDSDAPRPTGLEEAAYCHHLPRHLLELAEGFNLIFYGFGSKRHALNDLARACAASRHGHGHPPPAHVLVLNGFLPSFSARDIIAALARLPGAPQGVQGVAQFLSDPPAKFPSPSPSGQKQSGWRQQRRRRLVLVIHNMDAPALRASKTRTLLGALASLEGVQIAGSVDHINAPLLWTSTELLAGRWLWHDLTTLAGYDAELAGADPASLRGVPALRAGGGAAGAADGVGVGAPGTGTGAGGRMTETAARHVLAAVTQRARKLFVLMGRRQLDALADAGSNSSSGGAGVVDPTTPAEAGEVAIGYDMLFNLARDHFVATNDTALRALLGEFKDHGLVVTVGTGVMGSGETLWIPLRKERLTKLLDGLEQDPQ
jgi:origin recognition complex subunit 2